MIKKVSVIRTRTQDSNSKDLCILRQWLVRDYLMFALARTKDLQDNALSLLPQIASYTLLTEMQGEFLQPPTQPSCFSFLRPRSQPRGLIPEAWPLVQAEVLCQESPCWSCPLVQGQVLHSGVSVGDG
jgi:hypothetical protein